MQTTMVLTDLQRRKLLNFSVLLLMLSTTFGTMLDLIPSTALSGQWLEVAVWCRVAVQGAVILSTSLYAQAARASLTISKALTSSTSGPVELPQPGTEGGVVNGQPQNEVVRPQEQRFDGDMWGDTRR